MYSMFVKLYAYKICEDALKKQWAEKWVEKYKILNIT